MRRDEQMQKKNYQKELDKKIEQIVSEKKVPRLFLHSCCAPCSSYVLEYLSEYFEITVFITIRIFFRRRNLKSGSMSRKN